MSRSRKDCARHPTPDTRHPSPVTFVLVHGAWHGGWSWKKTADLLRAAGCTVYTPSLTGLGERAHLLSPSVDLTTHIDDTVGVLEYEDLREVVLVGHSYGGMVISGVAERVPSRIGRLVYLDAFLPENGEALRDYLQGDELDEIVSARGDGWSLPSLWLAEAFGITDEVDAAWVNARLGDQPYLTFTQPLELATKAAGRIRGVYIKATGDRYDSHAARARARGFACYELLGGGHDVMLTRPAELAALLLSIARPDGG